MKHYQLDYATGRPQMYDRASRERKASRIVKILESFLGTKKLRMLTVLDVGSSTGFIDNYLAKKFKNVVGIDIDVQAVQFAQKNFKRKNLKFKIGDAMKLNFLSESFDVVICSHVYEHVPSAPKLFSEIYRVLKYGGVCYLAALNRLWPWEPHYDLPLLSWLPKKIANLYLKITRKGNTYYESTRTYWGLKKLTRGFKQLDYTPKILKEPELFGYEDMINPGSILAIFTYLFAPIGKYIAPTLFWLLVKEER